MRSKSHLDSIKNFVDFSYTKFSRSLHINLEKKFNPDNPELGYCYKYKGEYATIYNIICSPIGIEKTDYRIMMHEYGHIYLGHLDGIHEELDGKILDTIKNHRAEFIEYINEQCNIDFAEKLLERIIDDPFLNHSLHNIAMDMEVNSKVLSTEDVEDIEKDVSSVLPSYVEEYLKYAQDHTDDESVKKDLQDQIDKMSAQSKIKLILPCRYHFKDGSPFPDELTYPEYLLLIINNLDQFVKMLVSIKLGGNGDTSNISKDDVSKVLNGSGSGKTGDKSQEINQDSGQGGSGGGMQSLDDLMKDLGMSSGNETGKDKSSKSNDSSDTQPKESPYKGTRDSDDYDSQEQGSIRDHRSDSRDEADRKRKLGQIRSSGAPGCGDSGGPDATRLVNREVDTVDMAIDEVIYNYSSKVIKRTYKKDMVYYYNRGINRSVIAPAYLQKISTSTNPTIVFLIDVSGSMDTDLVDRILKTISKKMSKIQRGLSYNIITWSTVLGEHIKDINPKKPIPRISTGGGTRMAKGIQYFKENYNKDAILILISDFEDYLQEWEEVTSSMVGYLMYGFNYGRYVYDKKFKNFKVKNFIQNVY